MSIKLGIYIANSDIKKCLCGGINMKLEKFRIEGDNIILSKKELEEFHELYISNSGKEKLIEKKWYYLGKADVLCDILKEFEYDNEVVD